MLSFSAAAAAFIEAQVSPLAVLLWEGLHGDAEVRAAGVHTIAVMYYSLLEASVFAFLVVYFVKRKLSSSLY